MVYKVPWPTYFVSLRDTIETASLRLSMTWLPEVSAAGSFDNLPAGGS